MRILVTGGAGFIGRRVAGAYAAAGHDVRVFDALLPDAHPDPGPPSLPAGVEFVQGDLRDPVAIRAALAGVELVSHHAAVAGRGQGIRDAGHHVGCNDLGTANLLVAMVEAGVRRLVHASSVAVYGNGAYTCAVHGNVRPRPRRRADLDAGRFDHRCRVCDAPLSHRTVTEDDPPDPSRNIYAITKLAQEHLVETWATETGGRAVSLRYHSVYGPEMPYESAYSGTMAVFRSVIGRGAAPEVYEDGRSLRDFVHVSDAASANVAALGWSGPGYRAFNVASGEPRSIGDVAVALAAEGGGPPPVVTGRYRIGDARHIVASPDRIMRELGWRPGTSFAEGMAEFAHAPMRGTPGSARLV